MQAATDSPTPTDILVVDDDAANLLAIEAALGELGAHLMKASSGEEALRQLLTRDFALVLLDVQMPGLDGFETARLIRTRPKTRHLPIIFITAHSRDDQDILQGYSLGAVDFLFKPIIPDVLRAKASVFVELNRRADEVQRQAALLREHERREHERRLERERQRWEAEALRRQMEEQQLLNEKLTEADRRKDEFLAVLAHELRNPLTPIVTGLELLQIDELPELEMRRTLVRMQRQATYLTRLVDDLLDVSRITRGKIELRKERFELGAAVGRAIETVRPLIEEQKHDLVVEKPNAPVFVDADLVRMTQILANLLHNAARYTEVSGKIVVEWGVEGRMAVLRVRDSGRGIAPEFIVRIFDIFAQERDGGKGLGLGLTLVKYLVDLHGGSVVARSGGRGHGSEFVVQIPVAPRDAAEAFREPDTREHQLTARQTSNTRDTEMLRVVVVEDDQDIRDTVRALLERWGHQVQVAADGPSGVELVLAAKPNVALLDVGLPGMDGYAIAERVRAELPNGSRPRLIAMTGYGQEHDRRRAREVGFDAHLIKPASASALRRALHGREAGGAVKNGTATE